ncbi:hypothetical protein AeMF1_014500 [Aphanomyces euteiches]|nr:hypothetical protein AeMF1_014500 [Aphanomyces euteiches]KAH9196837.1 hypothetical protein AeNC1_001218 [Aphanomyces euteiches]
MDAVVQSKSDYQLASLHSELRFCSVSTMHVVSLVSWLCLLPVVLARSTGFCNLCDVDQDRPLKSLLAKTIVNNGDVQTSILGETASIATKSLTLRLQMQKDGNLDVTAGKPIWASMTKLNKYKKIFAKVQRDGNFVVYGDWSRHSLWSSNTVGKGQEPHCIAVSDNSTRYGVRLYDSTCAAIWSPTLNVAKQFNPAEFAWNASIDTSASST